MSSYYELSQHKDLEAYDIPRYACDEWCDKCEDFIREGGVFYTYEGKSVCQKHYKQYLKKRGVKW